MKNENQIIIYTSPNNGTKIEVKFEKEQIWLDAHKIGEIFNVDRTVIVRHIGNIYKSGELMEDGTCAKIAQVAADGKIRKMNLYNLDAILSVGYRVNSNHATHFRQWATARLKEYLVQGYSINQSRLDELGKTIKLLTDTGKKIDGQEARGLLEIIANYTESFLLLNQYDSGRLEESGSEEITYIIDYTEAKNAISELKNTLREKYETSDIFGIEKDQSFIGILSNIIATFDGVHLYTTIEEQASHLLYFVIKDHPFIDGNKRIGAFLFIWFLEKNKHRFRKNGEVKINDTGLTALALLIAQSDPKEKDMMIKLIINLINQK